MTHRSDSWDVCFFGGCPRHDPPGEQRPGWLDDDEQHELKAWSASDGHLEVDVIAALNQFDGEVRNRERWRREALTVRRHLESLPAVPWADDPRAQSAVRYWLRKPDEQQSETLRVRVGANGGRFIDPTEAFATLLPRVRWSGDRFQAQCPAHQDRSPSLSVARGDGNRLLFHCHAGCTTDDVLAAVGWRLADLFPAA